MIHLAIKSALEYSEKTAIVDSGESFSYQDLLKKSESIALALLDGREDLKEARIAFIIDPSFEYVAIQWGIWRAGGIAVPLCVKHPYPSLQYVLEDSSAEALLYSKNYSELIQQAFIDFSIRNIPIDSILEINGELPKIEENRRAMILYTSGTTGKPKGVVSTHKNIQAQVNSLVEAWEWNSSDHILNVLPLHHIHGIVNALCCPLSLGATVEFLSRFKESLVFEAFERGEINVFMAVPTIYYKLISYFNESDPVIKERISNSFHHFRLMVSGSAALPNSTLNSWKEISGHTLLERYGMTEMGMAISNPFNGERRPGHIGQALPGVRIRLADDDEKTLEFGPGEIQIKGENVFLEYWNKPQATEESFIEGWFKTGDVAVLENGYYRILGRNSVDIIKTGGYKVSALEIEEVIRKREDINDCGVVGIPDDEWGEIIGAGIVANKALDEKELNSWLKELLPNYKMPRQYVFLNELPRNVLGKVTKKDLQKLFEKL